MLIALGPDNGATEGESIAYKTAGTVGRCRVQHDCSASVECLRPHCADSELLLTINGHTLRRNCLLKHDTAGKIEEGMEVMAK
jgi:hypothetical protein